MPRTLVVALALVSMSAVAGRATSADGGTRIASTPFLSTRPGEVLVPVTVGGRGPFRFLLDTGSTHTAVTAELAAAVNARPVARTTMRASGGTIDCVVVALPAIAVGGSAADDITATALPAAAGAALRGSADGILGQDFLARFSYTLDYRRRLVVWHDADYVAPGLALPLIPASGRFLVELSSGAGVARRLVPDSGADTLVLYGTALVRDLVREWQPASARLDSLTGSRTVRTALVDGLRVGPAILDRVITAVVVDTARRAEPLEADGLLPLHLFASVSFNARRRSLVIRPS